MTYVVMPEGNDPPVIILPKHWQAGSRAARNEIAKIIEAFKGMGRSMIMATDTWERLRFSYYRPLPKVAVKPCYRGRRKPW